MSHIDPNAPLPTIPGYQIHKVLGAGGMATVYLATQEKLKREVALKVILPQHAQDAEFRSRFISEGQLTARLYHRHIMTVFDIGEANGCFFMATEVLSGGTLAEKLPSIGSVVEKLLILREVAEGLGYAHSHSIVHRDIKPGNILFRADGTAVVADFGIAKALDMTRAQTLAGMIVGTPSYMSPEQVQGQPLDGRSDLYSLGVMLYEMLTGELPFTGPDPFAVAMAQIARPAPELPPRLAPLQALLSGLLEKLPARRTADAAGLCAAIDALLPTLDDAALSAGAVSKTERRARTSREMGAFKSTLPSAAPPASRWRWQAAAAAILVVIVGTVSWIGTRTSDTSEPGGATLPTAALGADADWLAMANNVRTLIAQKRFFEPSGGSAHDVLTLMLAERPSDLDAIELTQALIRAVVDDADQLLAQGARTKASLLASQAQMRFANVPEVQDLARRLRNEASDSSALSATPVNDALKSVDELRALAKSAIEEDRIASPADHNAITYLRALLRQQPDDSEAARDLQRIADSFAAQARRAQSEGDSGKANAALQRGLQAVPGDPELLRLQQTLSQAGDRPR